MTNLNTFLGDIESGRTLPSPELTIRLSDVFNVPKNYFYDNNNIKNDDELDDEIISIAMDLKKLPDDKKDLLKKIIKTMSESNNDD